MLEDEVDKVLTANDSAQRSVHKRGSVQPTSKLNWLTALGVAFLLVSIATIGTWAGFMIQRTSPETESFITEDELIESIGSSLIENELALELVELYKTLLSKLAAHDLEDINEACKGDDLSGIEALFAMEDQDEMISITEQMTLDSTNLLEQYPELKAYSEQDNTCEICENYRIGLLILKDILTTIKMDYSGNVNQYFSVIEEEPQGAQIPTWLARLTLCLFNCNCACVYCIYIWQLYLACMVVCTAACYAMAQWA